VSLFGASRLTARALGSGGAPVTAGTEIVLTTDRGRLDSSSLFTDQDGRASTQLRGTGAGGTATITARLQGTSVSTSTQVTIGVGLVLDLRAEPSVINGDATSRLTANLTNDGTPVSGTQIDLATTRGRLTTPSPRTDSLGNAVSELRPEGDVGIAVITATTQGVPAAQTQVEIGTARMLSLVATPAGVPTNGVTQITCTVTNFDGSSVGPRITVRLSTTLGRLDDTDPRTNGAGIATTLLRGDGRTGSAMITARVSGAAAPAIIDVTFGGDANLGLAAAPTQIGANGSATLTALLSSNAGNGLSGEQITFTTTLGVIEADRQTTDSQGVATTRLLARGTSGVARVTATADSLGVSAVTEIRIE